MRSKHGTDFLWIPFPRSEERGTSTPHIKSLTTAKGKSQEQRVFCSNTEASTLQLSPQNTLGVVKENSIIQYSKSPSLNQLGQYLPENNNS